LIAGVVATLYSWPSFDKSPWPAHILIGASFILSLLSVRKALQLSFILRRLELHGGDDRTAAGNKIRRQLATLEGEDWVPSRGHEILWNSPVLYLNLATISLLLSYAWGIFAAAVEVGFDTGKRETKVTLLAPVSRPISNKLEQIAVGLLTIGAISIPHYWSSETIIYFKYITWTSSGAKTLHA
jgi:hypothetical protein